ERTGQWLADVGDTGVVRRSRTGSRPEKLAIAYEDGDIVDACFPATHQSVFVVLPQFVSVTAVPVAGGVVPLVLIANGNSVVGEGPQRLHQPIIEFAIPLAGQERPNLVAADDELAPIAPHRVFGVGESDAAWVA